MDWRRRTSLLGGIPQVRPTTEALIVEFPVQTDFHYWRILVADDRLLEHVDWVDRRSSLDDIQATHRFRSAKAAAWCPTRVQACAAGSIRRTKPWGVLQARYSGAMTAQRRS